MKNNNPVYQTIYTYLSDQIVNGTLLPGQMLPSENELCRQFSTTRETVRRGLTQLTQEGLIYSQPKRGYFVSEPKNNDLSLTINPKITESISRFKDIRLIRPDIEVQNALPLTRGLLRFIAEATVAIFRLVWKSNMSLMTRESHPSKTKSIMLFSQRLPMPKLILSATIPSLKSQLSHLSRIFSLFWSAKRTSRFC